MSKPPAEKQRGPGRPKEERGAYATTILLYPGDVRMADELKEYLGTDSRSDVYRTALRQLYVSLLGKHHV